MQFIVNSSIAMEEKFDMMKAIQAAALSFGIFTLAFRCHMLHEDKVKSRMKFVFPDCSLMQMIFLQV